MKALVVLPFLISLVLLSFKPVEKVFLWMFFPGLLAVSTAYYFPLPGLPDLNFFHFASLPIMIWWLFYGIKEHEVSTMDVLVFGYALTTICSEFLTMGAKDGINIVIDRFLQIFMPYLLVKHFFRYHHLRIPVLKMMVAIGAVLALLSPPELKFDIAITDPLFWIWPENTRLPGLTRFGLVRVAATFTHPILAGLMWAFFSLFAVYLHNQRAWRSKWVSRGMVFLNLAGLMLSISRGPMLGLAAGFIVLYVGWNRNRAKALTLVLTLVVLLSPPVVMKFVEYISIDRFNAVTREQESAAYRRELFENYIDVIKESPWIGYGIEGVPVVGNQRSVDNQYLFISLRHGVFAFAFFIGLTFYIAGRLTLYGWRHPPDHSDGRLAWVLIGCAVVWFVTLATVWMGAQSEQMIFLVAAMADTFGREAGGHKIDQEKDRYGLTPRQWTFKRTL